MDTASALVYGAVGGGIVEAVVFFGRISAWQNDRHKALGDGKYLLPSLRRHIDPTSDIAVGITRLLLGAGAGWLFHLQITGSYAAIAVGSSAPALLRQLGTATSLRESIQGEGSGKQVPQGSFHSLGFAAERGGDAKGIISDDGEPESNPEGAPAL